MNGGILVSVIKLAFMGFGNAAQAFSKIVIGKRQELLTMGYDIRASVVVTASKGNCFVPEGVSLEALLQDIENYGMFKSVALGVTTKQGLDLLSHADYDVFLELSPLNIHTGQPAIDHIKTAMHRHKHVITANKGPIAWAYKELKTLSQEMATEFLFETTVMDGTPLFNLYRETLPLCKVTGIKGILNTTTNFILESMESGLGYDEAMEEGRRRGFVEADPSLDIQGYDAAAKLCALMNVMMDANSTPDLIDRQGIEGITQDQILSAKSRGFKIKLLCEATFEEGHLMGRVKPTEIALSDAYAQLNGTSSVVTLTTDLMGAISILEHDPEIEQTGFGIFSDLMELIRRLK